MINIGDLQRDALTEVFNIGVGRAASGLGQIVSDAVELSVPQILFVDPAQLGATLVKGPARSFSIISQDYRGPFDARAALLFPEEKALMIVAKMIGDHVSPQELSEMAQEALCEIGNIILNGCMSALADIFAVQFECSLPVHRLSQSDQLDFGEAVPADVVLVLHVTMRIQQSRIEGDLLFLLSFNSLTELLHRIDSYLARVGLSA